MGGPGRRARSSKTPSVSILCCGFRFPVVETVSDCRHLWRDLAASHENKRLCGDDSSRRLFWNSNSLLVPYNSVNNNGPGQKRKFAENQTGDSLCVESIHRTINSESDRVMSVSAVSE